MTSTIADVIRARGRRTGPKIQIPRRGDRVGFLFSKDRFLLGWKLRTWGPVLLLLAISLSPRFPLGQIAGGRALDIRVEDLLLLVLVPLWLGRGRCPFARPFLPSIVSYLCIASVSTSIGILMGWVDAVAGFFFFLKEVEYFLIFFFVADSVQNQKQVKVLLGTFILLGLVDLGWKSAQLAFSIPFPGYGPDSPFEYDGDDQAAAAATLPLAIAIGLFMTGTARQKVLSILLMGAFSISLMVTLKRSLIGAAFVVFVLGGLLSMFRRRTWRYVVLGIIGLASLGAGYSVAEKSGLPARARLTQYQVETRDLAERVQIWQDFLQRFFRNPVLGVGKGSSPAPGGAHGFYVLLLAEVGILGLLAYMWVWISVGCAILNIYRAPPEAVLKWMAVSWLLATAFIAIGNIVAEYLLTVRPAESYWFLSGVAVGAARLALARTSTAPDRPRVKVTAAS